MIMVLSKNYDIYVQAASELFSSLEVEGTSDMRNLVKSSMMCSTYGGSASDYINMHKKCQEILSFGLGNS